MNDLMPIPGFTDPFSSLSHLAGAAVFGALGVRLVRRGLAPPDEPGLTRRTRVATLAIFAGASVLLLALSGIFHLLPIGEARGLFRRLDHAAIFVLIAATFTPTHTIPLRGVWRWGMLVFIWAFAVVGVILKMIYFHAAPEWLGLSIYVVMGWCGLVAMIVLGRREGFAFVAPLLLGGIVYTAGAAVELFVRRPLVRGVIRAHEIFHLAVLGGLGLHWCFVWRIAAWRGQSAAPLPRRA